MRKLIPFVKNKYVFLKTILGAKGLSFGDFEPHLGGIRRLVPHFGGGPNAESEAACAAGAHERCWLKTLKEK